MSDETRAYYKGEFFSIFDLETDMWGVFHTDYKQGHCFGLFVSENAADKNASERNETRIAASVNS